MGCISDRFISPSFLCGVGEIELFMPFLKKYLSYFNETEWSSCIEERILLSVGFLANGEEVSRENGLVDFLGEKINDFLRIAIDEGGGGGGGRVGDPFVLKF